MRYKWVVMHMRVLLALCACVSVLLCCHLSFSNRRKLAVASSRWPQMLLLTARIQVAVRLLTFANSVWACLHWIALIDACSLVGTDFTKLALLPLRGPATLQRMRVRRASFTESLCL